jgi:hypothetical protein
MSLKIAALSSLAALSAFRAHAPADDKAQNLGPVWPQEPLPTTVSRGSSGAESKKPEAGGAASRRQEDRSKLAGLGASRACTASLATRPFLIFHVNGAPRR